MEIVLIILGIFLLYWRCLNYYYLIDDIVRRWGYLYDVPEMSPPPSFYSTRPHKWRHLFLIITHSLNVWVVYLLWGWVPAALLAFSPLSVPMTAWITGGYYAVTTLLTLTSYFFLQLYPGYLGAAFGAIFYAAALGSTITCLGFPFIFLFFNPWGLTLFFPIFMYLTGRRFTKGYKIRDMGKQDALKLSKIAVMIKVTAYYIYNVVFPYRLAFFRSFGEDYIKDDKVKKELEAFDKWFYLSLGAILLFILIGWQFSPLGTVWFLALIAPFSQFKVLGQFVAERYLYLPSIGFYLILAGALSSHPVLLFTVLFLYALRAHRYIPAYECMESLYLDGIKNQPQCLANYANLGERHIHMGRLWEGKEVLYKGLQIDSDNFLCYTNIAAYWVQVKDLQKGIYFTQKSIETGKTKSSWHIVKAMEDQMKNLLSFEKKFNWEIFGGDDKKETSNAVAMG